MTTAAFSRPTDLGWQNRDALRAMQGIDLFGRGSPRKKLRSKRKKKDRKRRSR